MTIPTRHVFGIVVGESQFPLCSTEKVALEKP